MIAHIAQFTGAQGEALPPQAEDMDDTEAGWGPMLSLGLSG